MNLKWKNEATLRDLAEQAVHAKPLGLDSGASRESLLHDLLVQDAELRMQNEALSDAQEELHRLHHRYKDLFENAPIGYLVADATMRISAANERAALALGENKGAIIGERVSRFVLPDEAIPLERYRREVAKSDVPLAGEFTFVTSTGQRRELRMESVCTNRETSEWRIAVTDVTSYNAMLRKLDHDERLGAFERHASGIAHDLNNLLYSILGHADLALSCINPAASAYAPIVRLRQVVKRCTDATEQLSSFTRAEESQPPIVDLNSVLTKMGSVLVSLLGDEVELELETTAVDAAVRLDPDHVEQILLTSVRNSRQAMPHGGKYRIETAAVELNVPTESHGSAARRFVRWSMSDTGVGMNESTRRRAFEPFFTTKPPGIGTGLGLAMVKAAVERAGGFAVLESELGRGTRLVLYLPRATGTSTFPPPSDPAREEGTFARVMIVKEDASCLEIADRLRCRGCDVSWSGSGSAALDMLREQGDGLNVLLIDKSLPEVVVGELIRTAEALSPGIEIIISPIPSPPDGHAESADAEHERALAETVKLVLSAVVRTSTQ
ncbi:MAG TPA: ATP-binding protein [Polyangiaceae bacterium]|nr:ATP-binding protein [Polyangiaceae bacterium]